MVDSTKGGDTIKTGHNLRGEETTSTKKTKTEQAAKNGLEER